MAKTSEKVECVTGPHPTERAYAQDQWLMTLPDNEYLQRYATPNDAQAAARDYNAHGIAYAPAHYERKLRRER